MITLTHKVSHIYLFTYTHMCQFFNISYFCCCLKNDTWVHVTLFRGFRGGREIWMLDKTLTVWMFLNLQFLTAHCHELKDLTMYTFNACVHTSHTFAQQRYQDLRKRFFGEGCPAFSTCPDRVGWEKKNHQFFSSLFSFFWCFQLGLIINVIGCFSFICVVSEFKKEYGIFSYFWVCLFFLLFWWLDLHCTQIFCPLFDLFSFVLVGYNDRDKNKSFLYTCMFGSTIHLQVFGHPVFLVTEFYIRQWCIQWNNPLTSSKKLPWYELLLKGLRS